MPIWCLLPQALWWIYNKSASKRWMFAGLVFVLFYTCWIILQMIATIASIILPLIFGVKLFLTVGMYKEGDIYTDNKSIYKYKYVFVLFYTCWIILQMIITIASIILPLIFGVKLFLTVGVIYI